MASFQGFLNFVGPVVGTGKATRRSIAIRLISKETVWITLFGKQVRAIETMIPLVEVESKKGNKYQKPSVSTRIKLDNVIEGEFNGKPSYSLGQYGKISVVGTHAD